MYKDLIDLQQGLCRSTLMLHHIFADHRKHWLCY
jgi:hypothetical protein